MKGKNDKEELSTGEEIRSGFEGMLYSFLFVIIGTFIIGFLHAYIVLDIAKSYNVPVIQDLSLTSLYGIILVLRFLFPNSGFEDFGTPITWGISIVIVSLAFWGLAKVFVIF